MHRLLLLLLFSFIFCGGREVLVAGQWGICESLAYSLYDGWYVMEFCSSFFWDLVGFPQ
jgi:hypothetical protein